MIVFDTRGWQTPSIDHARLHSRNTHFLYATRSRTFFVRVDHRVGARRAGWTRAPSWAMRSFIGGSCPSSTTGAIPDRSSSIPTPDCPTAPG
eukprot:335871-Pyramimonas_sp.AAC.1